MGLHSPRKSHRLWKPHDHAPRRDRHSPAKNNLLWKPRHHPPRRECCRKSSCKTSVNSVHQSYPLVAAALLEAAIADGKQLATWGAFDTKLKGGSENGPVGFYQTYRQDAGFRQPIYHGGEVFGGYRIGRGFFEPWYLERQTNDGGEFKAGLRVPLARDRWIDERRADLWRATYDRQRVRPEIRADLIEFVREASFAYWMWIAAGRRQEIGETGSPTVRRPKCRHRTTG